MFMFFKRITVTLKMNAILEPCLRGTNPPTTPEGRKYLLHLHSTSH